MKKWFALLVVLAVGGGGIYIWKFQKKGTQSVSVETEEVGRQKIIETVTATGKIQPKTQVKISADVSGKITKLNVKEGQWVNKGDHLLDLDRESYEARVEQAEANLRSAQSNVRLAWENMSKAEKDFQRIQDLAAKKLEPQSNLDAAKATAAIEKARHASTQDAVERSKAELKQAKDDLSKTIIYAPMSGTISQLNKEEGEIALGSQFQEDVIMIIADLEGMEALVDVDENDIVAVSLGDKATIEVDALPNVVFEGQVSEIANSAKVSAEGSSEQKTEFEVKITILEPGNKLRPGMTASADIVTDVREEALAVPIQAVTVRTPDQLKADPKPENDPLPNQVMANDLPAPTYEPDKDGFVSCVFTVNNGKVAARQVKTGIQSETHIEILSGLEEGDQIVTGSYRVISKELKNGTEVASKDQKNKGEKSGS